MNREQFSARFDHFYGGATSAPATRVRDVVICLTDPGTRRAVDEYRSHPPVGSELLKRTQGSAPPVDLGRGVTLTVLPRDEADLVMNACTPRGHYFSPIRQFGQRCSLVQEVELEQLNANRYAWDRDGVLTDALMLSRLVRDNGYSTEYAARIIDFEDGEQQVVYTPTSESKHVYRVRQTREWLDYSDADELRELLTAYWEADLPPRVRRAMWRTEYASWLKWGDLITPLLVSGLEALIKTEQYKATRQFVQRVVPMADELGFGDVDAAFCERMYDARSEWVHGARVQLFATGPEGQARGAQVGPRNQTERSAFEEIALLQDVLRAAVRTAIEDEGFRTTFADDDAIRERWPVSG